MPEPNAAANFMLILGMLCIACCTFNLVVGQSVRQFFLADKPEAIEDDAWAAKLRTHKLLAIIGTVLILWMGISFMSGYPANIAWVMPVLALIGMVPPLAAIGAYFNIKVCVDRARLINQAAMTLAVMFGVSGLISVFMSLVPPPGMAPPAQ